MPSKIRTLRCSQRERELLARYGCPFDELQAQLDKYAQDKKDRTLKDEVFWWEQVAGQLAITVNEELALDDPLFDEINALADRVELLLR